MKLFKITSVCLIVLTLVGSLIPNAVAEEAKGKTLTITIDRRVMPQSVLNAGLFFIEEDDVRATVTLRDFVIRDYSGDPIDGFIIQTASGQTKIPVDKVKKIEFANWVERRTEDIDLIENVREADILLLDGQTKHVLMNADFGKIEGKTDRGNFFLAKPHTVMMLVFDR